MAEAGVVDENMDVTMFGYGRIDDSFDIGRRTCRLDLDEVCIGRVTKRLGNFERLLAVATTVWPFERASWESRRPKPELAPVMNQTRFLDDMARMPGVMAELVV